jgi:hypothetical protein
MVAAMMPATPVSAAPSMTAEPIREPVARPIVRGVIRRVIIIVRVAVVKRRSSVIVATVIVAIRAAAVAVDMVLPRLRRGCNSKRRQRGHPKSDFAEEFHSK